jgi:membrane protein DedA with SNARE-associated domain
VNLAALYVYWVIVGWIFITGIGLIPLIPEELAVSGLGAWIHQNPDAFLFFSWLICVGAVLGTDLFLYMIGRVGGRKLLKRKVVQRVLKPERIQTFARKFQEQGIWFMLTARLIPGWRSAVFITAGVIRYPVGRFVIADGISSIPLVTFFFFGGFYAADWINSVIDKLHELQHFLWLLAFISLVIVSIAFYIRWMRQRQQEEAAEEAEAHDRNENDDEPRLPPPLSKEKGSLLVVPPVQPDASSAAPTNGVLKPGAERPVRSKVQ